MKEGRRLSHYKVLRKLGAGGMGEVYLADDTRIGRKVALKILPERLSEDPESLRRFEREARTLGSLDHPHIVTLYSVEQDDGVHFLTMAYVEGWSLRESMAAGGLPVARLIRVAIALADALRAAHEKGVVHRDLKPGNVMVDLEGRVRVLDFGLAKLTAGSRVQDQTGQATITAEGTLLGTVPYMSPEQLERQPVDGRSDLFSLGVILYEMAAGRRPFQGDSAMAVATAILRDEPAPLADLRTDLPPDLARLVGRCLEKNPARRTQSARELVTELTEIQRDLDTNAAAGSVDTTRALAVRTPEHSARPWLRWGLAACFAAAIVIGVVVGLDPGEEHPAGEDEARIASLAVLPLDNLSGDSGQEYFADGMTEALITDLSKIGALRVISRTSVMRFKNTDKPLPEIARELGVEAVVVGSIQREDDDIGIHVQLIEAVTDRNLWANSYVREVKSILTLQSELARDIAGEIRIQLTPQEARRLDVRQDVDPEAYDAYLKGVYHRYQFTPQDLTTALRYFNAALEVEPDYAAAHVGAGSVWAYRRVLGLVSQEEACRNWNRALSDALVLDTEIAEAHVGLAQIRMVCDWDWPASEAEYRRAIAIQPGNAEARMFYANFLGSQRRAEEAERETKKALELDPLNAFYHAGHGVILLFQERHDEAIEQFERSLEIAPGGGFVPFGYWRALYWSHQPDKALEQLRIHLRMLGENNASAALSGGAAKGGYREAARRAAVSLAADSLVAARRPMILVYLFDDAGDRENALVWLEKAYGVRDLDMAYLSVLEVSEELRSDPRYLDLLHRLELPVRPGIQAKDTSS